MAKIIVIGGAGYIGSHTVNMLCDDLHEVTVVDNLSTGKSSNVDKRASLIMADMCDMDTMRVVMQGKRPNVVFCFAGLKAAGESNEKATEYARVNIGGVLNVLHAMKETDIRRFIFSSSAAVYGIPETVPITEKFRLEPINYYGHTKLAIEKELEIFADLKHIQFASLRYFNAAGFKFETDKNFTPHRETSVTNLLPIVMETALGERPYVEIFGTDYDTRDGTGVRDYIHVSDLADAHIRAMNYLVKSRYSYVCNLGSGGSGYSVNEVIAAATRVTGRQIPVVKTERRVGDPDVVIASFSKAKDDLNWNPRYDNIEDILSSMWKVYSRKAG